MIGSGRSKVLLARQQAALVQEVELRDFIHVGNECRYTILCQDMDGTVQSRYLHADLLRSTLDTVYFTNTEITSFPPSAFASNSSTASTRDTLGPPMATSVGNPLSPPNYADRQVLPRQADCS